MLALRAGQAVGAEIGVLAGHEILDAQTVAVAETVPQAEIGPGQIAGAGIALGKAGIGIAGSAALIGIRQTSFPVGGERQASVVPRGVSQQGFARGFQDRLILLGPDGLHRAAHHIEHRRQDRPGGGQDDDEFGQGKPFLRLRPLVTPLVTVHRLPRSSVVAR